MEANGVLWYNKRRFLVYERSNHMLQEFGGEFRNEYIPRESADHDYVMCFRENRILVNTVRETLFPTVRQRSGQQLQYLFSINDRAYYLDMSAEEAGNPEGSLAVSQMYVPVRSLRDRLAPQALESGHEAAALHIPVTRKDCFAAATAYHLCGWYRDNRFCGRCGNELEADRRERMLRCPCCGNNVYPKIAPAVIIGLVDGDRILVSRYANRSYRKYALLAGFTEIGETAEETVRREVMEEVGLKVQDIKYYKSQPWGYDSNLLLGYFARLEGSDRILMDREELATAEWVSRKDEKTWELLQDDGVSLTREMMDYFLRNGHEGIW